MTRNNGFTLIEMLVATTMLVLLAAGALAVLSAGMGAEAKSKHYDIMLSCGQAALASMTSDIRCAIIDQDHLLISLDEDFEGKDADTIDFIAARMPRLQQIDDDPTNGLCEVGYYIENNPDTDFKWLLRREDGSVDEDPLEGGQITLVGPQVAELNLQFYDGLYWYDGWDNDEEPPVAVYIQIVVVDTDAKENPLVLSTTVPILAQ